MPGPCLHLHLDPSVTGRSGGDLGSGLDTATLKHSVPQRQQEACSCSQQVTLWARDSVQPQVPSGSWHPSPAMGSPLPHPYYQGCQARGPEPRRPKPSGGESKVGPGALCHCWTEQMIPRGPGFKLTQSGSPGTRRHSQIPTGLGSNPDSTWLCCIQKSKISLSES